MIQGVCVWQGIDVIGAIAKINNVSIHSERGECTVRVDIFASPEQLALGVVFNGACENNFIYDPLLDESVFDQAYAYLVTTPAFEGWVPYNV
jgi:hypothetical protein